MKYFSQSHKQETRYLKYLFWPPKDNIRRFSTENEWETDVRETMTTYRGLLPAYRHIFSIKSVKTIVILNSFERFTKTQTQTQGQAPHESFCCPDKIIQ